MESTPTVFVASDLEGTLTTGETWRGVLRVLRERGEGGRVRLFLARMMPPYLLSRAGVLDPQAVRERWITELPGLLRGATEAEMRDLVEEVVERDLWPGRREDVLDELRVHLEAGRTVVLASGTYQPVLDAFARRLGGPETVRALGTPLEWEGGRLTGRVAGPVAVGETKAHGLLRLLRGEPLHAAYGDTVQDVPMLRLARQPVAVSPDGALLGTARQRGWRVLGTPSAGAPS